MLVCSIFPSAAQKVFRQQLPQRYDNERVGWKIFNKFSNRFFFGRVVDVCGHNRETPPLKNYFILFF